MHIRMRLFVVLFLLLSLASCGGSQGSGGAVSGTTQVTIPFASSGGATVAGGALTAQTTTAVPAAVQSMKVTAKNSAGTVLATAIAIRPTLIVTMNLANVTGVAFTVQAFDIYGTQIYQGLSGATNLTGVAVTVPVTEQVVLGGIAATGLPITNGTITITDAAGTVLTMPTDATGSYLKVLPTHLVYPLLLVSTQANGVVIASLMTRLGTIHTNTFSTLAATKALGVASYSQISAGFTSFRNTYAAATTPVSTIIQNLDDNLSRSVQTVMQQLGLTKFTKLGKADPLHDAAFVADGTGLDGVMDSVRMEERDIDGDGKGDLILAGRGGVGTPILSLRSGSGGALSREAGSLALSGAVIAGDSLNGGALLTELDSIVVDGAGKANMLTTTVSPATLGLSNQSINHFVSAVAEAFDEANVTISDPYNQAVVSQLIDKLLLGFQSIQAAGGTLPVGEASLDNLSTQINTSLGGKVVNGKVSSSYSISSFVNNLVTASTTSGVTASSSATVANSYARAQQVARVPVSLVSPFTVGVNGVVSVSSDVLTKVSPLLPVAGDRSLEQKSVAGGVFEAVSMLANGSEGWAVGQHGLIQHTADSGTTWTTQAVPDGLSNGALIDVYAADANHVWAGGRSDTKGTPLLLFYNGSAWSKVVVPSGVQKQIMDVVLLGASSGYAVSKGGQVLRLAPSGASAAWSLLSTVSSPYSASAVAPSSAPVGLNSIAVDPLNTQSVWVLSDAGIYHSADGGVTWGSELTIAASVTANGTAQTLAWPFNGRFISVYGGSVVAGDWGPASIGFKDTSTAGYFTAGAGILSSNNGGSSWNYVANVATNFLHPQMINNQIGFALDTESFEMNQLFQTKDGGVTWNPVAFAGGVQRALGMDFIDAYTGWVVGENQLVAKIDMNTGVSTEQQNRAGAFFESISMLSNGSEGWVVGQRGVIQHTTNGGMIWANEVSPIDLSNGALIDVYAVDSTHVWAVGRKDIYSGVPVMLFNNGAGWSQVALLASVSTRLMDVVMVSATTGYAVANGGEVLQTTNGTAWTVLSTVMSPYGNVVSPNTTGPVDLTSIAVDPTNTQSVWVLADQGAFHSINGGATWEIRSTVSGGRAIAVYGNTVLFGEWPTVAHGGVMRLSHDGGVTWQAVSLGVPSVLRPQMIDANVGFAVPIEVGDFNLVFKTVDGGLTWSRVAVAGGVQWVSNLDFIDAYTGWVVGESTLVTKVDLMAGKSTDQQNVAGGFFEAVSMLPNGVEGWAVGQRGIIEHTTDGGVTWVAESSPMDLSNGGALIDVQAVDATHVWAVGRKDIYSDAPVMLFYNGTAWSTVPVSATVKKRLMDVKMMSATTGYAVAGSGEVLKFAAGAWSVLSTVMSSYGNVVSPNTTGSVNLTSIAVDPTNTQSLWVLSDQGIYHSIDGGVTWGGELTAGKWTDPQTNAVANFPIVGRTLSVYGGTVVAGEWNYGGVISSQDGGVTWNYQPWIANGFFRPQMLDANIGFAIDAESSDVNRVFKTVDGGLTWQVVATAGGIQWATNLDFIDAYTGWVVGENELVTKIIFSPLGAGINNLTGSIINATNPVISGKAYALLYSTDWTQPLAYVAADSAGSFQFSNLPDGSYNLAAVIDSNGLIAASGQIDQSVDPIGDYINNPLTIAGGVVTDKYGTLPVAVGAAVTVTGLSNRYYFPVGTTPITWSATDSAGTVTTASQNIVVGVSKQSWDVLRSTGDTAAALSQFTATLANDPTNIEAAVGLCVANFANLMTDPLLRPLLQSMTSDNGATLPSSSILAMSVANRTSLQKVNWLSQMAITGTRVQSDAFAPVVTQIGGCITSLESVMAAGFVSQTISNPAALLGGAASMQLDGDDLNMMLAQMYGLRSQIYWLDAFNWDTDVDGDGVTDTLPVTFTDTTSGIVYQYRTISTDPYAVFHSPTFFTKRAAGAMKGSGAQNLTVALADAQVAAAKAKTVMTNFNSNSSRGLDGNHLFSFADVTSLSQTLTDATNADNALNGTGYAGNFSGGGTATAGSVRVDLAYPLFDRSKLPSLEYDLNPDPVASKKNNKPTVFDDGAGNKVFSDFYPGAYPDPTLGGAFGGGAALDQRDRKVRPNATVMLNIAGVPISSYQYAAPTGAHSVFWPGGIMGDKSNAALYAVKVDQNSTLRSAIYTVYNVDTNTGALSVNLSGTLTGRVYSWGSGTSVGGVFLLPGSNSSQTGFWKLSATTASLVPVIQPTSLPSIVFANVLRSAGTATGLVHWYWGDFVTTRFVALSSLTSGGTVSVREQYPLGALDSSAIPLGTDVVNGLGWLIFEPSASQMVRVVTGATPISAQSYYSPWLASSWSGRSHLFNGQMVDTGSFPKVSFYPLPALSAFSTPTTAGVTP